MIKRGEDIGWLNSDGDVQGFTCTCDKCGSLNVVLSSTLSQGSAWTGVYGSIDLECEDCKNTVTLYD